MFDEKSLRKPGWEEGEWIRLADGQEWSFRRPAVATGMDLSEGGERFIAVPGFSEEPELGRLHREALEATKAGDAMAMFSAWAGLAFLLLEPNYELPSAVFEEITRIYPESNESMAMYRKVLDLAMGGAANFNIESDRTKIRPRKDDGASDQA